MSIHRSLKTKPGALNQHRNVLARHERVAKLIESEKFDPEQDSPIGLPKVLSIKVVTKKKAPPKAQADAEAAADGEAGADSASES